MSPSRTLSLTLLTLMLGLTACYPTAGAEQVKLVPAHVGFTQPTVITHAGDGSNRLFVAEKTGALKVIDGGAISVFLDLSETVSTESERGLLGVAFHPQYADNGRFFVNYTNRQGDTVIAEFRVSDDRNRAERGSERVLLIIPQPYANHNGGQLAFGPDGYLYIGTGDGGSAGDPLNAGQELGSLLGKILRIDVDGGSPYAIPADNPFVGRADARPEIWAYGLRNPWRFSFDRATGDLWIADVGQNAWEEVNFQPAISPGGENYGWRLMEGPSCYQPAQNCNDGTLTLPLLTYSHASGQGRSVTGGFVYRGTSLPALRGAYLFGDFVSGRVWAASSNGSGSWSVRELANTGYAIATFGEDEAGELYLADFGTGVLYRFVAGD